MVRRFKDIDSFLKSNDWNNLKKDLRRAHVKEMMTEAMETTCVFLEEKLKEKFGHYQEGWEILALATQKDRSDHGYTANDPLLRSGSLRDSIEHVVSDSGKRAAVGSKDWRMVWQEYGTATTGWKGKGIPPRPVFKIVYMNNTIEAAILYRDSILKSLRLI